MAKKSLATLSPEEREELYTSACKKAGMPIFNTKTVKVGSLIDFTKAVLDTQKELDK